MAEVGLASPSKQTKGVTPCATDDVVTKIEIQEVTPTPPPPSNRLTVEHSTQSIEPPIVEPQPSPTVESEPPKVKSQYPGDFSSHDDNPLFDNEYKTIDDLQTLQFPSPLHLGMCVIPSLRDNIISPYAWQVEINNEISSLSDETTLHKPFKYCLCAANGSGKDAIIAALSLTWFALKYKKCLLIVTSSSGSQLTAQTENHLRNACQEVNKFFGQEFFRIRQRYIKCLLSGSEIRLFATDEAGKAEGYHPLEPNAKMVIWVNEAKTVSEEIFEALRRCTGYTHWFNVSSPGSPKGSFYRSWVNWPRKKRVTSYDCTSHLSEQDRNEDRLELGEDSALYRSKHLALFTSLSDEVVIPLFLLEKARKENVSWKCKHWPLRVGIDLAAGGDENSVTIVWGNKIVGSLNFREADTTITVDRIHDFLLNNNIAQDSEYIFADDGGIGHAIIDSLRKRGWNITRVNNQSAASDKVRFGNRGAQNWYRIKRFFELGFLLPPTDSKLCDQLVNRYYKKSGERDRIYLEKKAEAKAHGRPSPDRADSFVLAYCGINVDDFQKDFNKELEEREKKQKDYISAENIVQYYADKFTYGEGQDPQDFTPATSCRELVC